MQRPARLAGAVFLFLVLLATGLYLALAWRFHGSPVDDAFITFRYAWNLAEGHGWVFNPGERVEGYVHPLWIALLAAVRLVSGVPPDRAAPPIGLALGAGTILLLASTAVRLRGRAEPGAAAAPLLCALSLPFLVWTTAGLETALFCFLLLLTIRLWLAARDRPAVTVAAVAWPLSALALGLTRPEGLFLPLVLLPARRPGRREAVALLLLVGLGAAWMAWRVSYYGHLLPNVFYAKHSARYELGAYLTLGWRYVSGFLLFRDELLQCVPRPWSTVAGAGLCLLAALGVVTRRGALARVGLFLALFLGVVAWEGGDWMPGRRFLVPMITLVALLAGEAFAAGRSWLLRAPAWLLAGFVLLHHWINLNLHAGRLPDDYARSWFRQRDYYDDAVAWARRNIAAGSTVILGDMGHIPYFTPDVRYVDQLGLLDEAVAHLPLGSADPGYLPYLLGRRPQFVISIQTIREAGGAAWGHTPFDELMLRDAGLARLFEPVADLPGWREQGVVKYFRVYRRR